MLKSIEDAESHYEQYKAALLEIVNRLHSDANLSTVNLITNVLTKNKLVLQLGDGHTVTLTIRNT